MVGKPMGFAYGWVWVMGYCRPMGYGMQFPVNQVGGQLELWVLRGYYDSYFVQILFSARSGIFPCATLY
jgi:hypothetical protein